MDAVDRFAAEAATFEDWARFRIGTDEFAVREALIRITRLYLAALDLPTPCAPKLDIERVEHEEWGAVCAAAHRLPFNAYSEVFDASVVPPEEPLIGSLADDITDIYRDVVSGLRAYQAKNRSGAIWEWAFLLQIHWGEHATSAIRAIHCWLAANASNRLVSDS